MEILVQHKGQAKGNPDLMELLWTESVSALSILTFIYYFCQYTNITPPTNCYQYCNNKAVVRQIHWYHKRAILTPTFCLQSDSDIQAQIEHTLQILNAAWSTSHVKGHQKGNNLPWEAQLNNIADELATQANKSQIQSSTYVPCK
eukprot:7307629-Ditylum_brightwellii.AAC.1